MLHIVTLKAILMKNTQSLCLIAISVLLGLSACTVNNSEQKTKIEANELVFANDPEPVSGSLDVYTSMARAVKYNVDVASQNLNKKIFNQNPNLKPQDIIKNVMNSHNGSESSLYDASRVLEFAIIYTVSNLNNNRVYVENNFYLKSSQHLAMAAIRSHQDTLFAVKKIKDINRLMTAENRVLKKLNAQMEKDGVLSASDLEYKKGLEVALLKLQELREALNFNVTEYANLTKIESKQANLEGRRFYELEDFDKNYNLEVFQQAAVRNRREFALAKELARSYDYNQLRTNYTNKYPEMERLSINGYSIKDTMYADKLVENANLVANNLVDAVLKYRKLADNDKNKDLMKTKVFDELSLAILMQVEVNFNIVKLTDADFANIDHQIANTKIEIRNLDVPRASVDQKVQLLDQKVALIGLELKRSQIAGERAVALRSLYFDAGFSPFDKQILKGKIKDVVTVLKAGFNKDVVEMLAASKKTSHNEETLHKNQWAKSDNWLEDLVDGSKAQVTKSTPVVMSDFEPYGVDANNLKTMQLGSFIEKRNANNEWDRLRELYPELDKYKPSLERNRQNDKLLYRLVVTSNQGGYLEICNKLRANKIECLLK